LVVESPNFGSQLAKPLRKYFSSLINIMINTNLSKVNSNTKMKESKHESMIPCVKKIQFIATVQGTEYPLIDRRIYIY
jgi:hypothetical protein